MYQIEVSFYKTNALGERVLVTIKTGKQTIQEAYDEARKHGLAYDETAHYRTVYEAPKNAGWADMLLEKIFAG